MTKHNVVAMLVWMANICDGCGERAVATRYRADGLFAGRTLCRSCLSDHHRMTRLSLFAAFKFRLAQVLPMGDSSTAPLLRLMMAVDDVRRAQIKLVDDSERLGGAGADKYTALGDWLYTLRLLISHLHEARRALLALGDRADALLADRKEPLRALQALRKRFSAADYKDSFIARVRNGIGFHYGSSDKEFRKLLAENITDDDLLGSTAASVGGLARMTDPLVRMILNIFNGGDFMVDENHTQQVKDVLHTVSGQLITVVDHPFDALMRANMEAVVEKHVEVVDVPAHLIRAAEAVRAMREQGGI